MICPIVKFSTSKEVSEISQPIRLDPELNDQHCILIQY